MLLCACGAATLAAVQADAAPISNSMPYDAATNGSSLVDAAAGPAGIITVCGAPWPPLVECEMNTTSLATGPLSYTGHDVELWREIAGELLLDEGVDYLFRCMKFQVLMDELHDPRGNCTFAIGGITVTSARKDEGVGFSYPYWSTALTALVKSTRSAPDGWGFVRPFTWSLWLAILLTLAVFPVLLFVTEWLSQMQRIQRSDWLPGISEAGIRTAWTAMQFDRPTLSSWGARLAALCLGFMSVVLVATYQANLTANITVTRLNSEVRSVQDLKGRAVGSEEIYLARLRARYGIVATDMRVAWPADDDLVGALMTGQLAAVVDDEVSNVYLATQESTCGIKVLPERLEPFDYAVALRKGMPNNVTEALSGAIIRLQEAGQLELLQENYVMKALGNCPYDGEIKTEIISVGFLNLWGLWVVLISGCVLGLLFMLATRRLRFRKHAAGIAARSNSWLSHVARQHSWGAARHPLPKTSIGFANDGAAAAANAGAEALPARHKDEEAASVATD